MDLGGELLKRFGDVLPGKEGKEKRGKKRVPTSLPSGEMTKRRGGEGKTKHTNLLAFAGKATEHHLHSGANGESAGLPDLRRGGLVLDRDIQTVSINCFCFRFAFISMPDSGHKFFITC